MADEEEEEEEDERCTECSDVLKMGQGTGWWTRHEGGFHVIFLSLFLSFRVFPLITRSPHDRHLGTHWFIGLSNGGAKGSRELPPASSVSPSTSFKSSQISEKGKGSRSAVDGGGGSCGNWDNITCTINNNINVDSRSITVT